LFDADGREVRRVDDTDLDEASFAFNAGKAGTYRLKRETSHAMADRIRYRIDVRGGGPQFQLQSGND